MGNRDLTTILDACVARVQAGESVEACVRDYPEYGDELALLLPAAAHLHTLPRPTINPQVRQRGRELMLAQLQQNQPAPVSFLAFLRYARQKLTGSITKEMPTMRLVLRSALTAFCCLILSTALVAASQNSLPGDPLYPVKRSWEWVQGSFVTPPNQASYDADLLDRRHQELQSLIEMGRPVTFELDGLLEQITSDHLDVSGFIIQVNQDTEWLSQPKAGQMVRVALHVQANGSLVARQVSTSDHPAPTMTATPVATVTPNGCNAGACPTATPTPCNSPNCVTATPVQTATPTPCNTPNCWTPTPTPACNPANCPTATPTPWCGAVNCPTLTLTPTPLCNTGVCPTRTPRPTSTATPNCNPANCSTATPTPPPTATPTACNTPNCLPPTATSTPGCQPAQCPTVTPTPGCNVGACPTATPTACSTPNCTTVTATAPPPATATATPGCTPNTCPTSTPTPGCSGGACNTPAPTPTQCNTPNCVTPTSTPPPGCSPANCPTPTPTPWCGVNICPTFTPTSQLQEHGLHSLRARWR